LWVSVIIVSFVVVVAVAALLSLLIYLIRIIDRRVVEGAGHAQGRVGDTADTVLIPQVADGIERPCLLRACSIISSSAGCSGR
jgi:hypothetical protein